MEVNLTTADFPHAIRDAWNGICTSQQREFALAEFTKALNRNLRLWECFAMGLLALDLVITLYGLGVKIPDTVLHISSDIAVVAFTELMVLIQLMQILLPVYPAEEFELLALPQNIKNQSLCRWAAGLFGLQDAKFPKFAAFNMASAVLGVFWAWYAYDEALTARLANAYKPLPVPEAPNYKSTDVSIIVATIDTPDSFTDSLRLWLSNNPGEIIIVTIERDLKRVHDLVEPVIAECGDRISLMTADYANKRHQLAVGIKEAKGKILALVDDDVFWGNTEVLPYLLAGFEDPEVGAAVGKQSAHITQDRRNSAIITPWEVASLRSLDNQNNVQAVRFAADGGCFCLVGRTLLMRTEIGQDPRFTHAITNDRWGGKIQNTGDDVFITRWLQMEGWKFSIQNAPEAEVTTIVMRDSDLLRQVIRWQRSAIQSFLATVVYEPGIVKISKNHPYMARKLIERLLRPILAWIHIAAFILGFLNQSPMAYFAAFWYIWGWIDTYRAFVRRFPWSVGQIWACFLLDNAHPILDIYAWLTMSSDVWGTRNESA
ncbi:hypothetical protein EsH8_IV_000269 [Colletotrichum jinshuiense]